MRTKTHSLQARLSARIALVMLIAAAVATAIVVYRGGTAADRLGEAELQERAQELARYIALGTDGKPVLTLPADLKQSYANRKGRWLYSIRDETGQLIDTSDARFASDTAADVPHDRIDKTFRVEEFGEGEEHDLYVVVRRMTSAAGDITIWVARPSDFDATAAELLKRFIREVAWAIVLALVATLAVLILTLRRGLEPLRRASALAAKIDPANTQVRLPTAQVPSELLPLLSAMNQALDRLERGFTMQRQFTANAAHELRTPLAILSAGLEELDNSPEVAKLRADATRMNRLVEQLLRVSRLDAIPLNIGARIDLRKVASDTLEYLLPWVVAQGRLLELDAGPDPVWAKGDADALADALRNLIENAVQHTPVGTAVSVAVQGDGAITVIDRGPGVLAADRRRIFERFARSRANRGPGAGLGLAIVEEIARAHGGTIVVADAPFGGGAFTLRIPVASASGD